jgi:hypothetical protein
MNNKQIQQTVLRRFSENQARESEAGSANGEELGSLAESGDALPRHLHQFIKMAEYRKRQILEKMLLDS